MHVQYADPRKMASLANASLRNARRLLDDAQWLAQDERYASAFSSACLAADEIGKNVLIIAYFALSKDDPPTAKALRKHLKSHQTKLGTFVVYAFLTSAAESVPNLTTLHERRLAATYTEPGVESEAVTYPPDTVVRQDYEETYDVIDRLLKLLEVSYLDAGTERLARSFQSHLEDPSKRSRNRTGLLAVAIFVIVGSLLGTRARPDDIDEIERLDPLDERGEDEDE
jgi:AbiV family abortive infection protein